MKKLMMFLVALVSLAVTASAVSVSEVDLSKMSKKERKEYEKRQQEIKDSTDHANAVAAIKSGNFILLVERRDSIEMNAREKLINFLLVENGKNVTFQTGTDMSSSGNNNLGGITVPTEIIKTGKLEEKKNGEVKCKYDIMEAYLSGKMNLKLNKKDNFAEIGITNNADGSFYGLMGVILPYDKEGIGREIKIGKSFVPDGRGLSSNFKGNMGRLSDYIKFEDMKKAR